MKKFLKVLTVFFVMYAVTSCATLGFGGPGKSAEAHRNAPGQQKK